MRTALLDVEVVLVDDREMALVGDDGWGGNERVTEVCWR